MTKIVALAGGVGGARLAGGLAQALPAQDLTVVVNTGDDFNHLGLHICPDLDTVCYTLAGLANPETGWGRSNETWNAFESIQSLGGPDWFRLGDRDLGTHLERTRRLLLGAALSQVTRNFCQAWKVGPTVLPMCDDPVPTTVFTEEGPLPFQEYFVHRQCQPRVTGFAFEGIDRARPAPDVIESVREADLVVICPSNPWVSIDPILGVHGIREAVALSCCLAVSPIIGGKAVKGPAAKMYAEMGIQPSALAVAHHYGPKATGGLLTGFVFDEVDAGQASTFQEEGFQIMFTNTIMKTTSDQLRLAEQVLAFGKTLH
ncbi:MAG: 2-phospho-L-lactate transferase [Omnitrophica WOR_2 bacterium]